MWGDRGGSGKAQRGRQGYRREEKGMEGKGALGGYGKGRCGEQLRGPRSLSPFTRQRCRPAPPSPVAMRRRQHPAGRDHALGLRMQEAFVPFVYTRNTGYLTL